MLKLRGTQISLASKWSKPRGRILSLSNSLYYNCIIGWGRTGGNWNCKNCSLVDAPCPSMHWRRIWKFTAIPWESAAEDGLRRDRSVTLLCLTKETSRFIIEALMFPEGLRKDYDLSSLRARWLQLIRSWFGFSLTALPLQPGQLIWMRIPNFSAEFTWESCWAASCITGHSSPKVGIWRLGCLLHGCYFFVLPPFWHINIINKHCIFKQLELGKGERW